jgi:hypothetical protein
MTSTSANPSKVRPEKPVKDFRNRDLYEAAARGLIRDKFQLMASTLGPDLGARYMLGIIHMETRGKLSSVIHSPNTPVSTEKGIGGRYWKSPAIESKKYTLAVSSQEYRNLREGLHATSICGVMGLYFVEGCIDRTLLKQAGYGNTFAAFGLGVNPGESISALFNPGAPTTVERAIAAGLIILDSKYQKYKKLHSLDPEGAIKEAVQDYLGRAPQGDAHGTTAPAYLATVLAIVRNPDLFSATVPESVANEFRTPSNEEYKKTPETVAANKGKTVGC